MKVNKTQALLFMHERLIRKGSFTKEEIMNVVDITNLTFLRYIQELRAYIVNFNKGYEITYVRDSETYMLNDKK